MSKRYSTESFKHVISEMYSGANLDFSEVRYVDSTTHVKIKCLEHGWYAKTPNHIQQGRGGCPECGNRERAESSRLPQEEFLTKAREISPHLDFKDTIYVTAKEKISVTCTRHSVTYSTTPSSVLKGSGCSQCTKENRSTPKNAKSAEEFFTKAKAKHCEAYDYSLVEYKNLTTLVRIVCNTCSNTFMQIPHNHLRGSGCKSCKLSEQKTLTTVDFISKAASVHGDRYGYYCSVYTGSSDKVSIHCNNCGNVFEQTPGNHLQGQGCPTCGLTGYDVSKPGNFYVMSFGDFTKVGITNRTTKSRARELQSRNKQEYVVLFSEFYQDGRSAKILESEVLKMLKSKYKNPIRKFEGSSESFMSVDLEELFSFINSTKGKYNV